MSHFMCEICGTVITDSEYGYVTGCDHYPMDNPGLAEIKKMEYLRSKAPCLARLDELAAYAAKDDEAERKADCAEMKAFINKAYE